MVLLTIPLVAAAEAHASALKYVSKTKTVPSTLPTLNGRGVAEAQCPDSHPRVTGGGVKITGDNSDFDLEVASTSPDLGGGGPDKWLGEANNSSGSDAQMTTTAICDKGRVRYPNHGKGISPHGQATKRVSCPSGTKLTGGGVSTEGDSPKVEVAASKPFDGPDANSTPDGWLGSGNNGTNSAKTLNVTAACADSGHYKYVHSATRPLPNNSEASASASCPVGTSVTGGGVENSGVDIGAEIESSFPLPDTDWIGRANNDNTGQAETVQTFAICKVTQTDFVGTFSEGGTVTFHLTDNHTKIHDWAWVHLPVQCREGPDVNSSRYRRDVDVHGDHFHAQGVRSSEGFKTTLDGMLTDHDTKAHGTLTMSGPEPPNGTRCHGTGHWSAHAL
ncbi:MAG: hypothetical protein ACRDLL_01385 [Solirubrobacterales bacterium]